MKLKRLLVYFMFSISVIFLLIPITMGVYYNVNRLISLHNYNKIYSFNVKKTGCGNYSKCGDALNSFLKCSDGVLGFVFFSGVGVRLPIYSDRLCSNVKPNYKNNGFKTSSCSFNNLILKLNKDCFLENMAYSLINVKAGEFLNINILGEDVKFKVENLKLVYDFNENIKNIGACEEIYILMPIPFAKSLYKFLITAKRVGCGSKFDGELLQLALENLYLVVLGGIFVLMFGLLVAFLFSRYIYISRRNRFVIRKKYVAKVYNFE